MAKLLRLAPNQLKDERVVERRTFTDYEARQEGNVVRFRGHAAVFDEVTDLGFFRERVAPGAFKKTIQESDVRFLYNHEPDSVMARTKNGTLRLSEDGQGLLSEADLPTDDVDVQRLLPKLVRGDVDQMSFAFRVVNQEIEEQPEDGGTPIRTLKEVELFDVSPVTFPAYEGTDVVAVSVRSLLEADEELAEAVSQREEQEEEQEEIRSEVGREDGEEPEHPPEEERLRKRVRELEHQVLTLRATVLNKETNHA